jgi:hypothetical protein
VAAVNNFALDAPVIMEDQASERYHLEIQHLRQQLHESHSMVGIFYPDPESFLFLKSAVATVPVIIFPFFILKGTGISKISKKNI